MIKISNIEDPDGFLRRTGTDISVCAYELQPLADSIRSNLYEILKLSDVIHNSNLIASIEEAIRFTEEVGMVVPAIIDKGEYFSKLEESFYLDRLLHRQSG